MWSLRRGGKHLALATTALQTELDAFAKEAGLKPERFDARFAGGALVVSKAVRAFEDNATLTREVIALVGNTRENMLQADAAGIGFIGVAHAAEREELLQAGAAPGQIIPNLKALPDFLGIVRNHASF